METNTPTNSEQPNDDFIRQLIHKLKKMEANKNSRIITNSNSVVFESDDFPFKVRKTILWRGITFHLKIHGYWSSEQTVEMNVTILINDLRYFYRVVKWKQWGDRKGELPKIQTSTHSLEIGFPGNQFRSFSLTEVLLNPNEERLQDVEKSFTILRVPDNIVFDIPKEVIPEEIKIEKNQVSLYEFKNSNESINSYAYFEKEDLVIDYWTLGGNYEDEYFITIKEKNLRHLFNEFIIESNNKAELLIGVMNAFKGAGCFNRVKEYLELKKIPYESNVRHG